MSIFFAALLLYPLAVTATQPEQLHYNQFVVAVEEGNNEAASIGTLVIRVNRQNMEVTTFIDERDGSITNTWIHGRGDEEIFTVIVTTSSAGSGSYGTLSVYDYRHDTLVKRTLPSPDPEQLEGYMGHDRYWFQNGLVLRLFPRYRSDDTNDNPTGSTALLFYLVAEDIWMYAGEGTSIECLLPER